MKHIVFGLLVLAATIYAQKWTYSPTPVPIKGAVTIDCTAGEDIDVYHKGAKVVSGGAYTVTKTSTPFKIDLRIQPVMEVQAGDYICQLVSDPTKKDTTNVKIQVSFPDNGKSYVRAIGKSAVVDFYIVGIPRPEIQYYTRTASGAAGTLLASISSAGVVVKSNSRFSISKDKGNLEITNVVAADGGDYLIKTKSFGIPRDSNLKLTVGEIPKFTVAPKKAYNLTKAVAKIITCTFDKAPSNVKWTQTTKAGVKKEITKISTGNLTMEGTNLKIAYPSRANEGDKWECFGINSFGNATAKTMINVVYEKPVIAVLKSKIDVVLAASATLKCDAVGNPAPVVKWSKKIDGKFVDVTGQTMSPGKSSYVIAKADAKTSGEYKCVAYIEGMMALSDSASVTVALLTPPKIDAAKTSTLEQYPVEKNMSRILRCTASGTPLPTVMFKKGAVKLLGGKDVSKDAKFVVMELAYVANKLSDAGTVTCFAKSSVGNDSKDIKIEMIDKPAAPTGLVAQKTENNYVMLAWSAPGLSEFQVYQDGNAVATPKATTIKIDNLVGGKTYSFSVAAKNMAGYGAKSNALVVTTLKFGKPSVPQQDPNGAPKSFASNVATFKWQAPVSDGGDKALTYEVQYCPQDNSGNFPPKNCKKTTTNSTSITIKGLMDKTSYHFKVTAINARGSGDSMEFAASTGSSTAPKTTAKPDKKPKSKAKKGLSGGAIAGIIVAVILILLIVIDLFCCFFNECGFIHCFYQACCAGKGKGKYAATDAKDPEKHELKNAEQCHADAEPGVEAVPEEKEPEKEKKTEDV